MRKLGILVFITTLVAPSAAHAGMPFVRLSDIARMRIEAISFFVLLILLLTVLVQWLWNAVQRDIPRLPRLSYKASLGVVGLWALGMHLVLSMIAGGRELMTPGAWEKDGATYKLGSARAAPAEEALAHARKQQLERLRTALWGYANGHGGSFPPHDFVEEIPEGTWRIVDPSGMHYVYVPGLHPERDAVPVAYEPGIYSSKRMVLLSSGEITTLDIDEIRRRIDAAQTSKGAP
ncbi:hypothetical protein [Polyangium jinanense]|uniref:Uncharacterized protein n=1 Tax=Polyangium jinanense TaxID=2829994 RepID=A0A9X3XDP6_9BACT|nr:hypothetical protein [Polyangium jinanense]MDC3960464.1 hypothetical protein [Polyangium jinanense]MDC3986763.1 hypothetical protein [Polyangium jinanense]